MKRIALLLLILLCLCFCAPKGGKVKKIMEGGVEVIISNLKPYKIKDEPSTLNLEEEFTIDTEREDLAEIGLTDMETFDVDPEGNIFIIRWKSNENYIFKFDKDGNFVTSFLRFGQGPGEIEWGGTLLIDNQNNIIAKDPSKTKFLVYKTDGSFIRETHLKEKFELVEPLENGKYLIFWQEQAEEFLKDYVGLGSSEFEKIKELDSNQWPNLMTGSRIKVGRDRLIYGASNDKIYIGNSERGYEIRAYDLEGNLLQKLRKKYKPVEISEEFKKAYLDRIKRSPFRDKYYFANRWPPFRDLFTDDEGRLFVMTYEKGINPGEYMYDIFNPKGTFITRTSLGNADELYPLSARAKNNRLYYIRKKDSGYKELVVYKMKWE